MTSKPSKCDLSLVCDRTWEKLAPTEDPAMRFCDTCAKRVFAVRTREELSVASAFGRCVALTSDNKVFRWIGKSAATWDWMEELNVIVEIRSDGVLAGDVLERLRFAYPRVFATGAGWPSSQWFSLGTFPPEVARKLEEELRSGFPELSVRTRNEP